MRQNIGHRGLMSRLPEDDAYWEALIDRLVADAAGRLETYRRSRERWWHGLARMSGPLVVAAIAALVAALFWLPGVEEGGRNIPPAAAYGFVPADPLGSVLVMSQEPPPVAALIETPTWERAP